MYKRRFVTRIILLAIVIASYGIAVGGASTGQSPKTLHQAVEAGKIADVKLLLLQGVDVNAKDGGWTALHNAARNGHKEIVEVLLANGAEINAGGPGYYNRTAAELAMWANHKEVVELLIAKGADVSPLHLAVHMKDRDKAKSLIEDGADVNKRTQYGTTPLHIAARHGVMNIAKLLIDHGANVNAKDNWNWTPLHGAVYGSRDMVELLISKGANVNAKDGGGQTPLHHAMKAGHGGIVELLLIEQTRLLSSDLARIAQRRKLLQQLTNHATPFEKKLLDIEELMIHLT